LIEPGNRRSAEVESFNGRFRDECLNEHWFTSLAQAAVVIGAWRREYNEERPKKGLGGLTPAAYAQQLTARTKTATVPPGSKAECYSKGVDVAPTAHGTVRVVRDADRLSSNRVAVGEHLPGQS
jgi:Integrase core domain